MRVAEKLENRVGYLPPHILANPWITYHTLLIRGVNKVALRDLVLGCSRLTQISSVEVPDKNPGKENGSSWRSASAYVLL